MVLDEWRMEMMQQTSWISRRIGPYRLESKLGSGAMGTVYRATHTRLERPVALKLLRPALERDPDAVRRFRREARSIACLEHPNIVPVYDAGESDGVAYIAMKLLEGESLRSLLDRAGPLPLNRVLSIAAQLARALDYAHGHGVVHLDVTPVNVVVAEGDRVVLTDFGIAESLGPGPTRSPTIVGTPVYMSPEQIQGQEVDGRSDIYSLGVVMYEMCAGQPPFAGKCTTIIQEHIHMPVPDVRMHVRAIPDALAAVIARALAKDPPARFQSAANLLRALERATDGQSTSIDVPATRGQALAAPADASALRRPGNATTRLDAPSRAAPAASPPAEKSTRRGTSGRAPLMATCALVVMLGAMASLFLSHRSGSRHAQVVSLQPMALSARAAPVRLTGTPRPLAPRRCAAGPAAQPCGSDVEGRVVYRFQHTGWSSFGVRGGCVRRPTRPRISRRKGSTCLGGMRGHHGQPSPRRNVTVARRADPMPEPARPLAAATVSTSSRMTITVPNHALPREPMAQLGRPAEVVPRPTAAVRPAIMPRPTATVRPAIIARVEVATRPTIMPRPTTTVRRAFVSRPTAGARPAVSTPATVGPNTFFRAPTPAPTRCDPEVEAC